MAFTPNLIQTDQIKSPNDLFNFSRDELILGVKKSKHPFHLCTFSSVHNDRPFARTVVSRGIDEHLTQCRIHSDMRSQKNKHILESPNVALVYYSQPQKLQVRFEGIAHVLTNKEMQDYFFDTSSPHSQLCYAYPSSPGTIITEKTKECVHPEVSIQNLDTCQPLARQNFSAIIITLQVMDALWLSTSGHVRIQGHRIENEWDLKFVIA